MQWREAQTHGRDQSVDAVWYVGDTEGAAQVQALSAGNLEATWTSAAAID